MQGIKDWLNGGRDYTTGVMLYRCYGDNKAIKDMLAQGRSDYRQRRLEKCLAELLETAKPVQLPVKGKQEQITVLVRGEQTPDAIVAPEKDEYRKQWLPLFMEMNKLRHQLRLMPNNEQRTDAAFEMN